MDLRTFDISPNVTLVKNGNFSTFVCIKILFLNGYALTTFTLGIEYQVT